MLKKETLIPAQIFVGNSNIFQDKVLEILKRHFCSSIDSDCYCKECRKLQKQQHENVVWVASSKIGYSVKDLDLIFEKISFKLADNEYFFFILEDAQTLNLASSNKLLKVLEEPPLGYNFILHTNNINSVLPTVVSRCQIIDLGANDDNLELQDPILLFFYKQKFDEPLEFESQLTKSDINDNKSIELFYIMFGYYSKKFFKSFQEDKDVQATFYKKVICYLKLKMEKLPNSGNSKLFWKDLYINFPKQLGF